MATTKRTFTLGNATAAKLDDTEDRIAIPKSGIVREGISEFHERIGRLSEHERVRMLRVLDELLPRIPERSEADVDFEISEIRLARHGGARLHPVG
jgi:hypothetical protein